jgi:hypothetical protein
VSGAQVRFGGTSNRPHMRSHFDKQEPSSANQQRCVSYFTHFHWLRLMQGYLISVRREGLS